MAVTYGFYNSVGGDRTYNAVQMSAIFDGLINDGIFMAIGTAMVVRPGTGMSVIVGVGRAWFKHTWTLNDSELVLPIDVPSLLNPRIDAVVLEIDATESVRANSIKVIKGVEGTVPVAPVPIHTATLNQYVLAYISVPVGLTSFTPTQITNKVGTAETPFVTEIIQTFSIDALVTQWGFEWDNWTADQQADFTAWFDAIKGQLSTDAAGNLQNQINVMNAVVNIKVIARQGGNATNWDNIGVNNYTPITRAAMQVGNAGVYGAIGRMTVTFPLPFSAIPLVYLTVDSSPYFAWITGRVVSISATGFIAEFTEHTQVSPYHKYAPQLTTACWMAVGPIA